MNAFLKDGWVWINQARVVQVPDQCSLLTFDQQAKVIRVYMRDPEHGLFEIMLERIVIAYTEAPVYAYTLVTRYLRDLLPGKKAQRPSLRLIGYGM
jgi:hypothetical protein